MKRSSALKKVLKLLKPRLFMVAISALFSALSVVLTLYVPILIGQAIDSITDIEAVKNIAVKVAVVIAVTALLQWFINIINNRIAFNTVRDIRNKAFAKIQSLPLSFLDRHPTGDIVSRVIADADQFSDGLLIGFSSLFTGIVTIFGTLIFMLTVNIPITAVVVILTPISFFVAKFIASKTHSFFTDQSKTRGKQTAFIDEIITGQKTVKAFGREDKAVQEFEKINDELAKTSLKSTFYSSLTNPCTRFVNSLVYTAVALTGALSVMTVGGITVGGLTCFLSYANQYTKPFNEISGVITEFQNALACVARIFELLEAQSESKDSDTPLENTDGNVSLEKVYFSYTADKKLIEDLNLNVKAGQKIAIVGPTGCGKTTLINLLMRFYDVNDGKISVDSTDIRTVSRKSLRANYGMVLQDTWLKSGTVRENITMGKPDATDEEVIAAAKASHAHSFIKRLKNGYDTVLKENGAGLSEGQRQLLCITRVMLALPPMLILDEATSSIDTMTEIRIQKAFDKMMRGRTTFIVAHRLSTIREADVILVMKDGNIIEQGSHDVLLKQNGFYTDLYNSQFTQ